MAASLHDSSAFGFPVCRVQLEARVLFFEQEQKRYASTTDSHHTPVHPHGAYTKDMTSSSDQTYTKYRKILNVTGILFLWQPCGGTGRVLNLPLPAPFRSGSLLFVPFLLQNITKLTQFLQSRNLLNPASRPFCPGLPPSSTSEGSLFEERRRCKNKLPGQNIIDAVPVVSVFSTASLLCRKKTNKIHREKVPSYLRAVLM